MTIAITIVSVITLLLAAGCIQSIRGIREIRKAVDPSLLSDVPKVRVDAKSMFRMSLMMALYLVFAPLAPSALRGGMIGGGVGHLIDEIGAALGSHGASIRIPQVRDALLDHYEGHEHEQRVVRHVSALTLQMLKW